ncbi:MAG: hypothetical protein AABX66_00525 [Nanoarchaeota archaeon]
MNNKAQIGKFLTGFVAFIFIIVIMGVFLALTTAISKIKGSNDGEKYPFVEPGFSLYKEVNYISNGKKEHFLIYDSLIKFYAGKINSDEVADKLKELVSKDRDCFVIFTNNIAGDNAVQILGKGSGLLGTNNQLFLPNWDGAFIGFENGVSKVHKEYGSEWFSFGKLSSYYGKFNLIVLTSYRDKQLKSSFVYYYLGKCLGGNNA